MQLVDYDTMQHRNITILQNIIIIELHNYVTRRLRYMKRQIFFTF